MNRIPIDFLWHPYEFSISQHIGQFDLFLCRHCSTVIVHMYIHLSADLILLFVVWLAIYAGLHF